MFQIIDFIWYFDFHLGQEHQVFLVNFSGYVFHVPIDCPSQDPYIAYDNYTNTLKSSTKLIPPNGFPLISNLKDKL